MSKPTNSSAQPSVQHGWFYFKQSDSGNLIGEYGHEYSPLGVYTESGEFVKGDQDILKNPNAKNAEFESTWMDPNTTPTWGKLEVERNGRIFKVKWSYKTGPVFEGKGILCDGVLIGEFHAA